MGGISGQTSFSAVSGNKAWNACVWTTKCKRVGLATAWVHSSWVSGRFSQSSRPQEDVGPRGRGAESQVLRREKGTSRHYQGPHHPFCTRVEGWLAPLRRRVRSSCHRTGSTYLMMWSQEAGDYPCCIQLSLSTCEGLVPGPPPTTTTTDTKIHGCSRPIYTLAQCLHITCIRG